MSQFKKILVVLVLVFSISCAGKKQSGFSFVQLCDTQLGFGLENYETDLETFKQTVVRVNELNPDFVVICGDLVHHPCDSTYADFLKIKEGFKMPCYLASGNHDVGTLPNDTTLGLYRRIIGKDYFEFQHKGYSFIVTNTQLWKADTGNESAKHDEWFKEMLKNQSAKQFPVFVIGHHPLYIKFFDEEEKYFNFPPEKRKELLDLFQQNNVVAYLSGHAHEVIVNNYNGIQLVSGETTSRNFDNRPFGFRLWQVTADSIKQDFVPLHPSVIE